MLTHYKIAIIFCLFLPLISAISAHLDDPITQPIYALINRVTPQLSPYIILKSLNSSTPDLETFTLSPSNSTLDILGTSSVALAVGYNYYLTHYLNSSISWTGDNLNQIDSLIQRGLPLDFTPFTKTRKFKYSYYMNVCTFSYSMVWWGWERWERELDFMAMKGVNLALAFTGQEYVYLETMKEFNVEEEELFGEYFTGPAFLAWQRMGNIRGWAGPLRKTWIQKQYELQLQILGRMNELGIKAILPAFSGFVPKRLKEKFPDANITQAEQWNGFPENLTQVYMVEPTDPLFVKIAKKYTDNLQKYFGMTDHFYNGDQFNEVDPSTNSTSYLQSAGKAMIDGLKQSDPKAIWVLQGWLFAYSPFWRDPNLIKAYLSGVEKEDILILDLYSDVKPVYNRTESYFGKGYIWNELHDFGGNMGMYGKLPRVMNEPFNAAEGQESSLKGVGITMEGIFQNMIVYELMLSVAWMESPRDLMDWTKEFVVSRYGEIDQEAEKAWQLLVGSVYSCDNDRRNVLTSYIEKRPSIYFQDETYYNKCDVVNALGHLINFANGKRDKTEGLKFDVVDAMRQTLSDYFSTLYHEKLLPAINDQNLNEISRVSIIMLEIIDDMDLLLGTQNLLLLGDWLKSATKWAFDNKSDIWHYKMNAKNQLTMWGPASNINDYASKQWNGLMKSYYLVRWRMFFEEIVKFVAEKKTFDEKEFEELVGKFEVQWNQVENDEFLTEPEFESLEIVKILHGKYEKNLKVFCGYKNGSNFSNMPTSDL